MIKGVSIPVRTVQSQYDESSSQTPLETSRSEPVCDSIRRYDPVWQPGDKSLGGE